MQLVGNDEAELTQQQGCGMAWKQTKSAKIGDGESNGPQARPPDAR